MNDLIPVEYRSKRILTTAQLADGYGSTPEALSNNFNRNRERYQEGKHFFCLEGEEKRAFCDRHQFNDGSKKAMRLYLWTEKGTLLHAKSLNTDQAWAVYDQLVETYFNVTHHQTPQTYLEALKSLVSSEEEKLALQAANSELSAKIELDMPKVLFADTVAASKTSILVGEQAKLIKQAGIDIGPKRFFQWLRDNGYLIKRQGRDFNMPTQRSMELGLFEIKETAITKASGDIIIGKTPLVTGKGQQYFVKLLVGRAPACL